MRRSIEKRPPSWWPNWRGIRFGTRESQIRATALLQLQKSVTTDELKSSTTSGRITTKGTRWRCNARKKIQAKKRKKDTRWNIDSLHLSYRYVRIGAGHAHSAQAMRGRFARALCGRIVCAFRAPIAIARAGARAREKTELSLLVGNVIYRAIGGRAHRTPKRDSIPTKGRKTAT